MTDPLIQALQVDRTDSLPLSHQIKRQLSALLTNGTLQAGDKLPHEVELCRQLGVSRWTLRKAIGQLVTDGLLRRTPHAGTFVTNRATRSMTVGFFYFREASHALMGSINRMHQLLDAQRFDLKVIPFSFDFYETVSLSAEMKRRDLAGAVLGTINTPACRAQLLRLESQRFPYIRLGNKLFIGQLRAPLVTGDDRRASRDALAYLGRLGHERIGYLGHRTTGEGMEEYLTACGGRPGFQERWLERLAFDGTVASWNLLPSGRIAREYLARNPDVTAVMTEHGGMAVKLLHEAQSLGRRVPEQLSLLCLEDWAVTFASVKPGLTSMALARETEAELAVERLLQIIQKGVADHEELIQLPFQLIERESVARPARDR